MQIIRHSSDKLKLRDYSPVHMTQDGLDRLRAQLERLKKMLPELITETARAAAYGDRSENAEYKEAKSSLRRTHRQILGIEERIKRAVVIKKDASISGKIQIGSTVVLETGGKKKTFEILGSYETDPARGRISFESPLGKALLNHTTGESVSVQTPGGSQIYRIIKVS